MKGNHCPVCTEVCKACRCLTCAKDDFEWEGGGSCCEEHRGGHEGCPIEKCSDWEAET